METIVNVTLPIFSIMLVGYLSGHWKLLGENATHALNRFVFLIALPPAMFIFTARADIEEILNWQFMGAYMLGAILTATLAVTIARLALGCDGERSAFHGFLAIFANLGYAGIPLFLAAFGPERILPPIIAGLIGTIPAMILIMLALEVMRAAPESNIAASVMGMFSRNPLFLATVAGIIWSYFALPLPRPAENVLDMMAATVGPTALFTLGLSLAGRSIVGDLREVGSITAFKLIVHPAVTYLIASQFFSLDPFWAASIVILAALPVGPTSFAVAHQYKTASHLASTSVALSTAGSIFTLTFLMIHFDIS